jgi:hypothetical protein
VAPAPAPGAHPNIQKIQSGVVPPHSSWAVAPAPAPGAHPNIQKIQSGVVPPHSQRLLNDAAVAVPVPGQSPQPANFIFFSYFLLDLGAPGVKNLFIPPKTGIKRLACLRNREAYSGAIKRQPKWPPSGTR